MEKGLIQIYTGDGKGKTTAAVGLAVRALGAGLKVCYIYFHKDPDRWGYGELNLLKKLGADINGFACFHPHFYKNTAQNNMRTECLKAKEFIEQNVFKKNYDLLILDEILIAIRDKYLAEEEVLSLLDNKPAGIEIVLTGRGATKKLIEKADMVSEIGKIKHPFNNGISGRKGIEF